MSKHKPVTGPIEADSPMRIIGGDLLRGRKIRYVVDQRTRPMKERVREALFNLVGPKVQGKHIIDLFAGTGALTFEAISRGAISGTLVERHFPTADVIKANAADLGVTDRTTIIPGNSLLWSKRLPTLPSIPWVVFCSPPYEMFLKDELELLALVQALLTAAPPQSIIVVESDTQFDTSKLPAEANWDVREYPPAVLSLCTK
jgi:16S rRNA (guanine966-N2)-methyltransferase